MDLGLNNGLFTNTPNGVHNGIYTGTNNGVFNGIYETINKGIIKKGLVLWLDGSRGDSYLAPYNNGQTAYDLSFNGNNCTSVNTVVYSSNFNGVWNFNGNNWYESVNNESLNLRITGTYSAWIYPTSLLQETFTGLITRALNGGAGFVSTLGWRPAATPASIYGVIYNGSVTNIVSTPIPTVANIWYHYVFTFSGTQLALYRNGLLVATTPQTIIASNVSVPIRIGGRGVGGSGGGAEDFNGSIGEVLIYNRALTAQEVNQNYLATKSRFNL